MNKRYFITSDKYGGRLSRSFLTRKFTKNNTAAPSLTPCSVTYTSTSVRHLSSVNGRLLTKSIFPSDNLHFPSEGKLWWCVHNNSSSMFKKNSLEVPL
ncbi:25028_t:CDS:2 [Dentiscutata erythropus]|uniref:25028_t:CDS:1 n=1 Tax=Dentiscutata erythropus TaxID=1348616 RepID=A0A9N9GVM5_9GLOM|nr:25028_t:CDS:2 [Dentiscutata erythropus]